MKQALLKEQSFERTFETQDIQLAASLLALGANFTAIDRNNPDRCTFLFEDSNDVRRSVEAIWRRQLAIEPQTLIRALKALQSRLYGERL